MQKENPMNRTKHLIGKLGMVLCTALLGGTAYGQVSVSVGVEIRAESDFYEPLTPQGEWIVVGSYGRCWRPAHVERDWRPYSEGYWQRTEAGWYWVSDEPWAWATYHYGRWNFTDQYGWYWVPQTVWAPAWVSWHSGGGYIGWAPMYPSGVTVIAPRAYVFVEERHFTEPVRRSTLVVNNTTIINKTTVINEGPATTVIEKASGRKVQAVAVQELRHKTEAAVVVKQKTPAATTEKTVQSPVRSTVETPEKKTVTAVEPAPVQKPAATTPASAATAPEKGKAQSETHKSVPVVAEAKPVARPEAKPAARPEAKPVVAKESTGLKTNKQPALQKKSAQPSDKKEQQPAKEKPVAGEKSTANQADNDHETKPKE
jgi:hypothetical protein